MRAEKTETRIRREQIAEAALELVASGGLKGLSVAKLARKVGFVPSAVYRHFPSKEDVLGAMLDLIRQRLKANIEIVRQQEADALERLRMLLLRHAQMIEQNQGIPRIIFSEESSGPRRAKVHAIVEEYLGEITGMVREGQAGGLIRSDLKAQAVAMMFLGMIQPAAFLWHLSGGTYNLRQHVEGVWEVFNKGIQTKERLL